MTEPKTVFVGKLRTGDPIIYISGMVKISDCHWTMEMLDELILAGYRQITFDYEGVINISRSWFEAAIARRKMQTRGLTIDIKDTTVRRTFDPIDENQSLWSKISNAILLN